VLLSMRSGDWLRGPMVSACDGVGVLIDDRHLPAKLGAG